MTSFSQRYGYREGSPALQIEGISRGLRNRIVNQIWGLFLASDRDREGYVARILDGFLKQPLPLPMSPSTAWQTSKNIRDQLLSENTPWWAIYDLVEFLYDNSLPLRQSLASRINKVLEEELAGYRLIEGQIQMVSSPEETAEIHAAMAAESVPDPVKEHLDRALELLAPSQRDYRNSIKESINAVEAIVCKIVGENGTLGSLLKQLKEKVDIHPALEAGFSKIYGWTSDANGIRHAMEEEATVGPEDARYMLVSCSAFINYLATKAEKAGLLP